MTTNGDTPDWFNFKLPEKFIVITEGEGDVPRLYKLGYTDMEALKLLILASQTILDEDTISDRKCLKDTMEGYV